MGTTERAEGEMDRVRDGHLMKEMNRWRRLSRQEMEREMKERRQSTCLLCHATAKKGPADTSVCACVFVNVCMCIFILLGDKKCLNRNRSTSIILQQEDIL